MRAHLFLSGKQKRQRTLIITLSISDICPKWWVSFSTPCQLMSIGSYRSIGTMCFHGNLEVKRVRFDTMNHNQSLLSSQHIGRVILPELSLFGAVKIPLAPSPGTHFLSSPLIDPVAIVSNAHACFLEQGLGSAMSYWFMNSALWRQCNNRDLNVRWRSRFKFK